jgi:hypothetical protein
VAQLSEDRARRRLGDRRRTDATACVECGAE